MWEISLIDILCPTKINLIEGSFDDLPRIVKKYGIRILLLTGSKFLSSSNYLERLLHRFKREEMEVFLFNGIKSNPTNYDVDEAVQFAKANKCEVIVAIGGGSVIDSAKMVSIGCTSDLFCWDFFRDGDRPAKEIVSKSLPLVVMPTTSGTGSEVTPFAVIKNEDKKLKKGVKSRFLFPNESIIDPKLLIHKSNELTLWTACDAFGQSLESLTSAKANKFSNMLALESLRLNIMSLSQISKNPNSIMLRENLALSAMYSGLAITQTETNLCHALAESVGSLYDIHHGRLVGMLTAACVKNNIANVCEELRSSLIKKYQKVVSFMDDKNYREYTDENTEDYLFYFFEDFFSKLGLDESLNSLNLVDLDKSKLAALALDMTSIKSNIVPVKKDHILEIFSQLT